MSKTKVPGNVSKCNFVRFFNVTREVFPNVIRIFLYAAEGMRFDLSQREEDEEGADRRGPPAARRTRY